MNKNKITQDLRHNKPTRRSLGAPLVLVAGFALANCTGAASGSAEPHDSSAVPTASSPAKANKITDNCTVYGIITKRVGDQDIIQMIVAGQVVPGSTATLGVLWSGENSAQSERVTVQDNGEFRADTPKHRFSAEKFAKYTGVASLHASIHGNVTKINCGEVSIAIGTSSSDNETGVTLLGQT